ncbi:MAG: ABC transporter permease [Lewinellaceae bacterium]|nr:ABC transporter permease [Lewinellaceae bacterium]
MIYTHIKVAWRNLRRHKIFSAINLLGLTTGTACCLYILLYVQDQRSYDKHHRVGERLYRITTELDLPGGNDIKPMATSSPPIAPAMQADFPEVELAARICSPPGVEQNLFRVGDRVIPEKKGYYADSTFFRLFDYHFLTGDPEHALDMPYSVVLSEKLALKLFNTVDVLDKTVRIGGNTGEEQFRITGVYNDELGKSHLMPAFFMSMNAGGIGEYVRTSDSWAGNNFIYSYLKLGQGADPRALEAKLPAFLERHGADQLRQLSMKKTLHLQPVEAIHTDANFVAEIEPGTSNRFLNILLIIAGFIQLVACINFMNLSTARYTRRAQEVGVRKSVGAGRWSLIGQSLSESMLLAGLAVLLAIPLIRLLLPWLNSITHADVALHFLNAGATWAMIAGLVLLTGLAAGSYPAFFLSSFQPISVIRGLSAIKGGQKGAWLRKGLVVGQFVVSAILIIGALVVHSQLKYMLEMDLGFEKNQKIVFPFRTTEGRKHVEAFRDELMRFPEVRSASAMLVCPGQMTYNDLPVYRDGADMSKSIDLMYTNTDEHYLNTLKINMLAGRFYTMADTSASEFEARVVLNETALRQLGIPLEQAPGTVLRSNFMEMNFEFTVIGVMQDFHFQNLSNKLLPYMVMPELPRRLAHVVADVDTKDYTAFLNKASALWKETAGNNPFEYSFLDEDIGKMYRAEKTLSGIISAFTLIAILISCLGLLGLATFSAEQRTKEIGIRKVMGASVTGLTGLLARDFLKLVVLAVLIASPLAWWIMEHWLEDFAYRIDMEWWMFALAGAAALLVSLLTVGFQAFKAALANPVRALRSD